MVLYPARLDDPSRPDLGVLVVDGDQDTLDMYAEALRIAGLTAWTTSDPDEALGIARTHHPDVVVSDIRLRRRFDGIELMERLRGDSTLASIPVLALTGIVFPEYARLASAAGCVRFLEKPCGPDVLLVEIGRALGTSSCQAAGAEVPSLSSSAADDRPPA